jgi:CO/xanthine dehydrogenase Mo-binding subunit
LEDGAPLVHENLGQYKIIEEDYPEPGTNIANHIKIRKGNIEKAMAESDFILETNISFPQSDHAAMETRCSTAEILPDGNVVIYSSSQSPFNIKEMMSFPH